MLRHFHAFDPSGKMHTRSIDGLVYTHAVFMLPNLLHDLDFADDPSCKAGYRSLFPVYVSIIKDGRPRRDVRDAKKRIRGHTEDSFAEAEFAARKSRVTAIIEDRKATGYYDNYECHWLFSLQGARTVARNHETWHRPIDIAVVPAVQGNYPATS